MVDDHVRLKESHQDREAFGCEASLSMNAAGQESDAVFGHFGLLPSCDLPVLIVRKLLVDRDEILEILHESYNHRRIKLRARRAADLPTGIFVRIRRFVDPL